MVKMIIFGGQPSTGLAWEVAKLMKTELGKCELKRFPDNEQYLKILTNVKGKECAVVSSAITGDDFMELFLMLDALKDNNALQVHAVLPYMAYARQDKQFTEGEALSAKTILKILDELSDDIITINCHFLKSAGESTYHDVRIQNIDAFPEIVKYYKGKLKKPIVIAPDKGSLSYAKRAAQILDCEFDHLQKKRVSGESVIIKSKRLDTKGKDILILDDIISTGDTILKASEVIRGWKPKSINVGCVHGLFLNGVEQFKETIDTVICTNTLNSPVSKISVAGLIAKELS